LEVLIQQMTVTFGNDNDVIIYALEKVIVYARRTQQIFVAQCVWWLASIIGFEQRLIVYIDNFQKRSEISHHKAAPVDEACIPQEETVETSGREVSATPQGIQEDSRPNIRLSHIHPDRESQVHNTIQDISDLRLSGSSDDQHLRIIEETEQYIQKSRKERKNIKKQSDPLSCTRSEKILANPLFRKQRNYLQSIPKDMIAKYLENRK